MVASLSEPAGVDSAGVVTMSSVGNIVRKQESSLCTSAVKRTPPPAPTYACTVTPPMTLPSRGWGDRDSGSEGCGVRHFSGFSCHSAADTGSITGSCSSSGSSCSHGSGSAAGTGGAGGGVGSGGRLRNSTGIGCGGRELKPFHLSDGFSSAEEETWGSEGEIEETVVAGRRRALVTLGPNKHLGATAATNSSRGRSLCAEEEDGEGDEESRGLLTRSGGSGPVVSVAAPGCAGGGSGLVPDVGARRKAAVGAGRAKRRHSSGARAGTRYDVEGRGPGVAGSGGRGSGGGGGGICNGRPGARCGGGGRDGGGGGGGDDGRGAGSSHKKRPAKVSRRLFIEIENKASEPPPPRRQAPGERGRAANRRQRGGAVAGRGLEPGARARRLGGGADGDVDGEQGDSGDEAMCGCAERCLRLMDAWYHTLTGSTARVKFSELDQGVSSSIP